MLTIGEILGNRYRIEALIAKGGMGSIYRSSDAKLNNKSWAVKEITSNLVNLQTFGDEVRILADLSHPYIPNIIDYFEPNESGNCYMVMELIQGKNLQDRFDESGYQLPFTRIIKYAVQLCDVLSHLHEQPTPVIFRDLKPSNIMIDEYDNIKLIDFGIARNYKQGQFTDTISLGTIAYAAPEQLENKQTDARSDLYSLGATLYYLLSGGKYYYPTHSALSPLQVGIPAALAAVIQKLLMLNPDQRFQSALSLRDELERLRLSQTDTGSLIGDRTIQLSFKPDNNTAPAGPLNDTSGLTAKLSTFRVEKPQERKPYSIQATQTTPALIIYLLDISGSMLIDMGSQKRIDLIRHTLISTLKQMVFRSTKGSRISSRYRMAIIAYSDNVYDLLGGVKSIEEVAKTGLLPELSPLKYTDTAKAFEYAEQLLLAELPNMQNCPAPIICHMTDGAHTGEDPEPIAKRIMEISVPDGNVIVENIFVSDSILESPIEDVKNWQGIMPDTLFNNEVANKLRRMSSTLPESYREMMSNSGYSLKSGALMMLPGTSSELVSLGFQISAATPILK